MAYVRARWYDTRNAAWLSEDPLLDIDSPNFYAFVAWQPTMRIDPMGEGDRSKYQGTINLGTGLLRQTHEECRADPALEACHTAMEVWLSSAWGEPRGGPNSPRVLPQVGPAGRHPACFVNGILNDEVRASWSESPIEVAVANWPSLVELHFFSGKSGRDVGDLIVFIQLVAVAKNNYSIAPKRTDTGGRVRLTKEEARQAVDRSRQGSPMDYTSTLAECQELQISVESSEAIASRIRKIRIYYPEAAMALESLLQGAQNDSVRPSTVRVPVQRSVEIQVELATV